MTIETAAIVSLFLLASSAVGLLLELARARVMAGVCMTAVLASYTFNMFHVAEKSSGPYYAYRNGVNVHTGKCLAIRNAVESGEELDCYHTLQEAKDCGLRTHYCITNRDSTYTAAAAEMPHRNPSTNSQILSAILPPQPTSASGERNLRE